MARSANLHTIEEIEQEITRLRESEHVRLYKKHTRLLNRRRVYMNQLRWEERKGRELAAQGYTLANVEDRLSEEEIELLNEMEE